MTKTDKKTLEEIIRVDHAGERGAIKIYEGQLLALKTFKQDEELKRKIDSSVNEKKYSVHLKYISARGNWYMNSWKGFVAQEK